MTSANSNIAPIQSIFAQQHARAKLPMPPSGLFCDAPPMRDWAIDYVLHVLEQKDWSANRLAGEAGLAASTIARPLRERDYAGKLSRTTIAKIHAATGIDPAPFAPDGFHESEGVYAGSPAVRKILEAVGRGETAPSAMNRNEVKVAVVGDLAQIVATVDREGLARLRKKIDAIEAMLDD